MPEEVSIELTNRCNFKCHFCPQSDPEHLNRVPATAIDPEQARILISKLREGGVETDTIHWTLDGEPFMNKRFHEVCEVACEFGFHKHHFGTNGFFTTPERLLKFPKANGTRYYLTVDYCSDRDYFEDVRGIEDSWDVLRKNITAVIEDERLPHINFKITDISSFRYVDKEDLEQRFKALKALFPPSDRVTFHTRVFHNATGFVTGMVKKRGSYNLCPYPWYSFMIASNGNVVACPRDLEHKTVLGNLFEDRFEDIWNGERYQAFRRALVEKKPCDNSSCAGCDMPYDESKFSLANMVKFLVHRSLLLAK